MMIEPVSAIIGTLAFGLHLYGKFTERHNLEKFLPWIGDNIGYTLSSVALCAIALLGQSEIMDELGFTKPLIYAAFVCYGGGHAVSRVIGMTQATKERKAAKQGSDGNA